MNQPRIRNRPFQISRVSRNTFCSSLLLTRHSCSFLAITAVFLACVVLLLAPISSAFSGTTKCLQWIRNTDSLVLAEPSGRIIISRHASALRIPASTLKVLTSLAAIHELGPAYRFKTEFYVQGDGILVIKGYGDPLLISEVLSDIAGQLSKRIAHVKAIITDTSYFSRSIRIPGRGHSTNPYDAPPSALSVNFNTIVVARDEKGNIISGEPQTPLTPLARKIAKKIGATNGRYSIGEDSDLAAQYAGQLFKRFLLKAGVQVSGTIGPGLVGSDAELIYTHYSPFTLKQVIRKMLKYSSNFIANQLLITMGARSFGPPGTLAKGLKVFRQYVKKNLELKSPVIVEGSGISRSNQISAIEMMKVLIRFMPYHRLMRKQGRVFYKTGTLKGVKTCVGYIRDGNHNLYPFVVFINRPFCHLDRITRCLQGLVPSTS